MANPDYATTPERVDARTIGFFEVTRGDRVSHRAVAPTTTGPRTGSDATRQLRYNSRDSLDARRVIRFPDREAMPLSYELERDWILIRAEGEHSYDEVVEVFGQATTAARVRRPVLIDARKSRMAPPVEEMRDTASFARRISSEIGPRVAVVVDGPLRFGLARMLGILASGPGDSFEIQAFREMAAARTWLGEAPTDA